MKFFTLCETNFSLHARQMHFTCRWSVLVWLPNTKSFCKVINYTCSISNNAVSSSLVSLGRDQAFFFLLFFCLFRKQTVRSSGFFSHSYKAFSKSPTTHLALEIYAEDCSTRATSIYYWSPLIWFSVIFQPIWNCQEGIGRKNQMVWVKGGLLMESFKGRSSHCIC